MVTPSARDRIALVTDSTSYLPPELVERYRVDVVPLQVVVGGQAHAEGSEISPAQVAEALRAYVPVSTSRPAPAAFAAAYARAAARGAQSVVVVTLSGEMSGTGASAAQAAREAALPVHVVDSRSLGMGMGFALQAAGDAAEAGADGEEAAAVAAKRAAATSIVFYVDTLEHLRRGGRIGAAQALLGSALAVKPLLQLVDGRIVPLEKVRTSSRALARMEEVAVERAGSGPVSIAVHHLAGAERAAGLASRLAARVPAAGAVGVSEVGAVVGAHVGPGMLAVVVSPA